MPAKTGGSHAFAAFVSMIVASVISKWVWTSLPPFERLSTLVGTSVAAATGATFSPRLAGTVVIASALAFVWGVLYHVKRH